MKTYWIVDGISLSWVRNVKARSESQNYSNLLWAEHKDPFIVDGSILTRTIVGTSDGAGDLGFVAPHWTGGGGINLRSSVLQNKFALL